MTVEIKTYEQKLPRIEVIKVTRENYNEVSKHIGAARVTANQGEFDVVQTVTFHFNNNDPLIFKIPVDFSVPYEAYIHRKITPNNDQWEIIRQYDLGFGWSPVLISLDKENN